MSKIKHLEVLVKQLGDDIGDGASADYARMVAEIAFHTLLVKEMNLPDDDEPVKLVDLVNSAMSDIHETIIPIKENYEKSKKAYDSPIILQ